MVVLFSVAILFFVVLVFATNTSVNAFAGTTGPSLFLQLPPTTTSSRTLVRLMEQQQAHEQNSIPDSNQAKTGVMVEDRRLSHVASLRSIASEYDTFLIDMWGVLHNGVVPYEGAVEALDELSKMTTTTTTTNAIQLVVLSNSSKRQSKSCALLEKLGLDPDRHFHQIITSGDVSHRILSQDPTLPFDIWGPIKNNVEKKVYIMGSGDDDEEYITSAHWQVARHMEEATLIVARGTETLHCASASGHSGVISKSIHGMDAYQEELERVLKIASARQIPMLVTNPDKVRPDADRTPMPGTLGDLYESMVGPTLVERIGKPHHHVYDLALQQQQDDSSTLTSSLKNNDALSSCLMIGDALETDVMGGTWIGCDTLWVINNGIHAPQILQDKNRCTENKDDDDDDDDAPYNESAVHSCLEDFNARQTLTPTPLRPTHVMPYFKW